MFRACHPVVAQVGAPLRERTKCPTLTPATKCQEAEARLSVMDKASGTKLANAPSCKAYLAAYTASMQPPKVLDRKDALATGAIVASVAVDAYLQPFALLPIIAYAGHGYLIYKWAPWAFSFGYNLPQGGSKNALKRLAKKCQEEYVAQ